MSSETSNASEPKLDLAKWAKLPNQLMLGGGILLLIGFLFPGWRDQFYYSYLTGFMCFLSLTLGSLFLVLLHHLFDAYWLVPVRRFLETCEQAPTSRHRINGAEEPEIKTQASGSKST